MPYRYNNIECDTIEELRALTRKRRVTTKTAARSTKKISKINRGATNSWAKARREAKRQNRNDIAAVRSEMAAAKRAL